jgi:putative transcriptional regulator
MPVSDDVALTGTRDILKAMAEGHGPREAMFALGYAGWGPGQIESEIRANGWIHCDADPVILFDADMNSKWNRALGKLGIDASALSAHAGRA